MSTTTYDPTTAFAGVGDTTAKALNQGGPIAVGLLVPMLAFGIVWRLVRKGAKG